MQGERIVVSGNFLIDSESKMKMAAAGMQEASKQTGQRVKDPVCAMEVDAGAAKAAGLSIEYRGQTYYFCMEECKTAFQKSPERYSGRPAAKPLSPAVGPSPGSSGKGKAHD
jgi:YHS domain-containing protein